MISENGMIGVGKYFSFFKSELVLNAWQEGRGVKFFTNFCKDFDKIVDHGFFLCR